MTDTAAPDMRSQLSRALTSLKEMRVRLEAAEAAQAALREPIAIVGMGCRLPGASSPRALWELVRSGVDAITATPRDRWDARPLFDEAPDAAGKVATRWGGFLDEIDQFDAAFFGISPREAAQMDPQQRILLEVAWEALEDAGQSVDRLAGSDTGVFVGVHSHSDDYYTMQSADPEALDLYSGTGTSHSVLSGRLSYLFDLRGPSIAVDTACSSSLVAVHLAVQSLRAGESSLAMAGGVNVMIDPAFTMVASRMRMMSPRGRCRPFDVGADGFVRAEGCATVVLKRLSDAQAAGDRVHALIAGSATNQDGRSNGLTAPNSLSQQAVIRAALDNAGMSPRAIDVVESHGTGTPIGDPIEVEALAAVFSEVDGDGRRVALGSLKANMGHTEGAAGVAALVKTVLSMGAGEVPPMLHFEQLNPHLSLDDTPFVIPTEVMGWPTGSGTRTAGVSSFGWSGTNAHVIVTAPPAAAEDVAASDDQSSATTLLLPLSARSAGALNDLALAMRDLLAEADMDPARVCASAGRRRSHHDHRLAAVGHTCDDLVETLDAFLAGDEHRRLSIGTRRSGADPVAFVFPGQGGQWPGMARDLLADEPDFHHAFERCATAIAPYVDWSPFDVMTNPDGFRLEEIDVIQPTLFAVQVAMTAWWAGRGVTPDAVVGHSMGEVAAAHVAGVLSLDDASRVICARSRLLRSISGHGAMAVVELGVDTLREQLDGIEDRVAVAVSNSASSTVVSGDPATIDALIERWKASETFCRRVNVDVASHSPQVDPLLDELVKRLAPIRASSERAAFMSTVDADYASADSLGPGYWARNLRQSVRFGESVRRLIDDGYTRFVELGPHPMLVGAIEESLRDAGQDGVTLACMRRDSDGALDLTGALAGLYVHGRKLDWAQIQPDLAPVDLPAYPWQRERHWLAANPRTIRRGATDPVDEMIHVVDWRATDDAPAERDDAVTRWLVVASDGADPTTLCTQLRSAGTPCTSFTIDEVRSGVVADTLGEAADERVGVVVLAPTGPNPDARATAIAERLVGQITDVLRLAVDVDRHARRATLWIVTTGAHAVVADDDGAGYAEAALWGLGRSVGDELPHVWGGCIDLDPRADDLRSAQLLAHELTHVADTGELEAELALRGETRYAQRLVVSAGHSPDPLVLDATALVTGGFGAVGRNVARWAVEHGARSVVLASRTPLAPREAWDGIDLDSSDGRRVAVVQELEALGATVHATSVDVGDETSLRSFLDGFASAGHPPVRSVFHAAAEFGGELVADVDEDSVRRQLLAKAVGAYVFDHLPDLDHLVLFSSIASVLPVAGQSAYAAANALVDALAHHRRAAGRPGVSINWGFWEGSDDDPSGAAAADGARSIKATANALLSARGVSGFSTESGLDAMGRLLAGGAAQAVVAPIDWSVFAASQLDGTGGLASDRIRAAGDGDARREPDACPSSGATTSDATEPTLRQRIEQAGSDELVDVAETVIRQVVAGVLRLPAERLDATAPFGSLGLDSLMSIELRNGLERQLGLKMSATVAWNYPTVRDLARHALDRLGRTAEPTAVAPTAATPTPGRPEDVGDVVSGVNDLSDEEALAALMGDAR